MASNSQGLSWSPDGSRIAFIAPSRALTVVEVRTGRTDELLPKGDLEDLSGPIWSPSGDFIAVIARSAAGFYPLVLTPDGEVVGRGEPSPGGWTVVAWRVGSDDLLVARERHEETSLRSEETSVQVQVISVAAWTPILQAELPGQSEPSV
ncbi:MAG TPA: hypothetical protein VNO79_16655 [Actinomycetota bacterium]|nr:hypothetical protein [Actinomycetota bacterium]